MSIKEILLKVLNEIKFKFEMGEDVVLNDYGRLFHGKIVGGYIDSLGEYPHVCYKIKDELTGKVENGYEDNLRKFKPSMLEKLTKFRYEEENLRKQLEEIHSKIDNIAYEGEIWIRLKQTASK